MPVGTNARTVAGDVIRGESGVVGTENHGVSALPRKPVCTDDSDYSESREWADLADKSGGGMLRGKLGRT